MKIGGFVVFAAAFFVTRVLLAPWAVLKVAAVDTMCGNLVHFMQTLQMFVCLFFVCCQSARCAWVHAGRFAAGACVCAYRCACLHAVHVCCLPWCRQQSTCVSLARLPACLPAYLLSVWQQLTTSLCCPCRTACLTVVGSTPTHPSALLLPACRRVMPYAREDFPTWWWGINVLLAVLYLMQLLWMKGIFRVLRCAQRAGQARSGAAPALAAAAAAVAPACHTSCLPACPLPIT